MKKLFSSLAVLLASFCFFSYFNIALAVTNRKKAKRILKTSNSRRRNMNDDFRDFEKTYKEDDWW